MNVSITMKPVVSVASVAVPSALHVTSLSANDPDDRYVPSREDRGLGLMLGMFGGGGIGAGLGWKTGVLITEVGLKTGGGLGPGALTLALGGLGAGMLFGAIHGYRWGAKMMVAAAVGSGLGAVIGASVGAGFGAEVLGSVGAAVGGAGGGFVGFLIGAAAGASAVEKSW